MIQQLSESYFVRGLRESDLEGPYPGWFEDREVCRYLTQRKFPKNAEHFKEYIKNLNTEDRVVWAVCHKDAGHIGNVSLQPISFIHRNAELGMVLGDKRHWRKGVGRLAGAALIAHGFQELDLERIYCSGAATNTAMRKLAESLGMTLESTRKEHIFLDGRGVDVAEYGILRSEFRGTAA